jgi:hypothetical protein
MITTCIRVVFYDGERLLIDGVTEFGILKDYDAYYISKNGFKSYFNRRMVKYFGRDFDLPGNKED